MTRVFLILVFGLAYFSSLSAQDFHMPAASPQVEINQAFSTSYIQLKYSRPSVNGRTVFGDLIPYGEVWRTGANASTKISFGEEVSFGGQPVGAGTYALYTIPGKTEWTVILNSGLDNWGADGFDAEETVLEIKVPVQQLSDVQESFSISLEEVTKDSGVLVLAWENTALRIPVQADNHERIMRHLARQLDSENPPHFQAASYYLATDEKLEEAVVLVDKAIEESPDAYYMYWTKAQILDKLGKREEALVAAKKAADMTRENSPAFMHEYQRNYENLKNKK